MILNQIRPRVLDCTVISGDPKFAGNRVLIPRISLTPSNDNLPVPLRRRQFPVRLAFSMTINKSQGQSVKHVGLNLQTPVFSHGQLYVALSRCTSGSRIKVLLPVNCENRRTPNIVYKEILNGLRLTCEYGSDLMKDYINTHCGFGFFRICITHIHIIDSLIFLYLWLLSTVK
jgi:Helicase